VPAIVLAIDVKRYKVHYLAKIVLPLILIVLMSTLVFWIDPAQSGTQIAVGTTAMLTLIAYRFAVGASLPKLPFMTLLDYFIMGSTLLVFTYLVLVIWTSSLARRERTEQARRVDLTARWVIPLLFLLVTLETLYLNIFV